MAGIQNLEAKRKLQKQLHVESVELLALFPCIDLRTWQLRNTSLSFFLLRRKVLYILECNIVFYLPRFNLLVLTIHQKNARQAESMHKGGTENPVKLILFPSLIAIKHQFHPFHSGILTNKQRQRRKWNWISIMRDIREWVLFLHLWSLVF